MEPLQMSNLIEIAMSFYNCISFSSKLLMPMSSFSEQEDDEESTDAAEHDDHKQDENYASTKNASYEE